jgi:hypothetical protein
MPPETNKGRARPRPALNLTPREDDFRLAVGTYDFRDRKREPKASGIDPPEAPRRRVMACIAA